MGNYYEWSSDATWKKYYSANGQTIAVRDQTGVQYLYGDNVGSVRGWSNKDGTSYGSQRYMPWGEDGTSTQQGTAGKAISDRKYTGQKSLAELGIYDYNARYYDPALGRFLQPDSIIPDPYNPMSYDRYAYVQNSPTNFNDPTGHWLETALDIAFVVYDIYDIKTNGLTWVSGLSLAADVAGVALPVVTGGGLAIRALIHADDTVKALNTVDNVIDIANTIDNTVDTANAGENLADALNVADNLPNKPYSNPRSRPSYGKEQVEVVWENAKQIDGNVYDPFTGEQLYWDKSKPRNGQWDMGHTPDHQYQDLWKKYMNDETDYNEFIRQYQNPNNYLPQSVNSNRSRRYDPR